MEFRSRAARSPTFLRNRFYIGEVAYKGEILPGEQLPIIDRDLFEAVQAKLAEQQNNHIKTRAKSEALLTGLIHDDRGNRMTPVSAKKGAVRNRYYVSCGIFQGRREDAGSVPRVPAPEIEAAVLQALKNLGKPIRSPEPDPLHPSPATVRW